ncbi:hypothetical protein [Eubacterium maltosivorans]|uniref:Lipoprotein n=1 Tax=Eubacterium maltosivorans TaxID=2041044 RepID=A0A4P9C7D5_EUBML|nr:hypothetical protein [Eubacterium maltosivorans]QCT71284.1 hypothetical protein CPZ25_008060 [Eubacterium maltosivorans]
MKKIMLTLMALALCLAVTACSTGAQASLEGSWHEQPADGTDQGAYQLTFNGDGTFEERVVSAKSRDIITTVSGRYTVNGDRITFEITGFASGGIEGETLMNLGGENSMARQYEIDGDTLYLYENEKQEGRTEKAFEGKLVRGPVTEQQ